MLPHVSEKFDVHEPFPPPAPPPLDTHPADASGGDDVHEHWLPTVRRQLMRSEAALPAF